MEKIIHQEHNPREEIYLFIMIRMPSQLDQLSEANCIAIASWYCDMDSII